MGRILPHFSNNRENTVGGASKSDQVEDAGALEVECGNLKAA